MTNRLGRYEILGEIGRGGFAIVYRARDTELDRLVALKELKPILLQDSEWVERFRREARAIARLDHPNIVPIYDVGEIETRLFLVMRLVEGPSLEELIAKQGRLTWSEVVSIITPIAAGLDYAHAQGILHRDLKPGNILSDPERGPMLTDFGLAKLAGESSTSLTANRSVVGTPHYIAPEIWGGDKATPQTDIYALACIVCEMLTGEKVFKGDTAPAVMMAHFRPVALPQGWPEEAPAGSVEVVARALANKPGDRYATAGELARAMAALTKIQKGRPDRDKDLQDVPAPVEAVAIDSGQLTAAKMNLSDSADEVEVEISGHYAGRDQSSDNWRNFLNHLGPYVIVIGALALINIITNPGGYLWFLWPAMAWGVGLAIHLLHVILEDFKSVTGKWHDFLTHFGVYAVVIGFLIGIYLRTSPGGYPWFIWPAMGWGIGVAIHLWSTMVSRSDRPEVKAERRAAKARRKEQKRAKKAQERSKTETNTTLQVHLERAQTYKAQIETLIRSSSDRNIHVRLRDLATQIDAWIEAIKALSRRVEHFQRDSLIQHDLETVPQSITKLEAQVAAETDAATRAELERTLQSYKNQLAALSRLQNMMKRAEIKIESTLSALGTIYSQLLIGQSTDQVADYGRLSSEINEEVRVLQDQLDALAEVKLGELDHH
jgi:serine/threonine protein kinase